MSKKSLFLIDGSAIAYRAYFAFIKNPLINSKGQNTSAIFGFLRFLFMIIDNENPDYLAVIFDPPGPTFRHKRYAEYKATREKMPDDMRSQVPQLHDFIRALNIPILELEGYEADDVIGTLAKRAQKEEYETFLVSGDKDFMQLVGDGIKLYNVKRTGEPAEILDAAAVEEKIGLPPSKVIDYLGLMGDTSDNVPGVRGVGEKTAVKLILDFGSLEGALENADEVSRANVRENLKKSHEQALLSKELVVIKTDAPIDIELAKLKRQDPDTPTVVELIKEFEFNSLLERFTVDQAMSKVEYEVLENAESIGKALSTAAKAEICVVDLETTHEDPMRADLVGIAISHNIGEAFYIPVAVEKERSESGIRRKVCLKSDGDLFGSLPLDDVLRPFFEDDKIKKSGHNIKYDMLVLENHGIRLRGVCFDTMVASFIINPTLRQHNLDALALEHFNYVKTPTSDLIGKGKNQVSMADVPVEKVAKYACEDSDITLKLHRVLDPQLDAGNLRDLFNDVEIPLIHVLMEVEQAGVALDLDYLNEMSKSMQGRVDDLIQQIYALAGEEFNINSTQQLGEILFEKLKLPKKKKTKTGYSTDVKVLEALVPHHDLPLRLIEYRELTKLKSTYVDALPSLVNPATGRLHTSYNQTVAATGRLSSSDPNLQNIPIRTDLGREIRRAFITADDDHVILDADYSQVELRVMAHLSQDPVLLEAFRNDEDIHTKTACLVFGIESEDLNAEHRRRAKEINFGIMYGMGVFGLASRLNISNEEAKEFIMNYFATYGKVQEFIARMHAEVEEKGYVTTILNRRRYIPEVRSKNFNIREFGKRTAVNTPIQGTAAELIKVAMIAIWRKLHERELKSRMIMQVHDELVLEVHKSELDEVTELVKHEMENAIALDVPLRVDVGYGANWLEAH